MEDIPDPSFFEVTQHAHNIIGNLNEYLKTLRHRDRLRNDTEDIDEQWELANSITHRWAELQKREREIAAAAKKKRAERAAPSHIPGKSPRAGSSSSKRPRTPPNTYTSFSRKEQKTADFVNANRKR